ncbi:hypothetical protein LEZ72_002904 [Escherichia coli]|nr:hypothetical protein [Escherichia coli]
MSFKLTPSQTSYLTRAMTTGGGLIELGELAKGLGKQKHHVAAKLKSSFGEEQVAKMETCLTVYGNGQKSGQTVSTYMLDYKTAAALAMSYDLQLGVEVLTILEDAVKTISGMTEALQSGDTKSALEASQSFSERMRWSLEYLPSDSENETRSKALKRLNRGGK